MHAADEDAKVIPATVETGSGLGSLESTVAGDNGSKPSSSPTPSHSFGAHMARKSSKSYFEKLRDPRWQRRRLEVMQAAGFECEFCGDKDKTFNVHHKYYERGADPWDYPDAALECLCEQCHESKELQRLDLLKELSDPECAVSTLCVLGYLRGMRARYSGHDLWIAVSDEEEVAGIAAAFHVFPSAVHRAMSDGNHVEVNYLKRLRLDVMGKV